MPTRIGAPMYDLFCIRGVPASSAPFDTWQSGASEGHGERGSSRRVGAYLAIRRLLCVARKRCASSSRLNSDDAPRRAWPSDREPLRNVGALSAPLERRRGSCPPSFRVAMAGSQQIIRWAARANARSSGRGAPDSFPCDRRGPIAMSARSFHVFPSFPNFGAPRLDFERPSGSHGAARARPARVTHVQQDDHRRLPSRKKPGWSFSGVAGSRSSISNPPARSRCAATYIWQR